mgnify:CR=1 FL=1
MAWSADGKRLAAGTPRWWEIKTWDASSGEELRTFSGQSWGSDMFRSWGFQSLAWNADGRRLAAAEHPGASRMWDAETGKSRLVLAGSAAELVSFLSQQ